MSQPAVTWNKHKFVVNTHVFVKKALEVVEDQLTHDAK